MYPVPALTRQYVPRWQVPRFVVKGGPFPHRREKHKSKTDRVLQSTGKILRQMDRPIWCYYCTSNGFQNTTFARLLLWSSERGRVIVTSIGEFFPDYFAL